MSDAGPVRVELYDTTLRDGAQQADLSYTVEDRLRILHSAQEFQQLVRVEGPDWIGRRSHPFPGTIAA